MMIPKNLTGVAGRGGLLFKKYSPEILTGAGLLAMTTGAFLAIRATRNFDATVVEARARIEGVKALKTIDVLEVEPYTKADYNRDLFRAYAINVLEFTKLYGPAATLFLSGGGAILAAHGIMHRRTVAVVAAYNALEKSYAAYRGRVIEEYGEEKDRDYRLGITESISKDENGKKVSVIDVDPNKMSRYSRVFDEGNRFWQREPGYNQFFLTSEQNYLNNKLLATGHVFLNEVYDRLGFERTQEGAVVGWIVAQGSDNVVDFGIYDATSEAKRNFINGYEQSIWLDFNVDGVIFDRI